MKKIIVCFCLISIIVCKVKADSLPDYTPDVVDELLFQGLVETHPALAYQISVQTQKAGFLKDVWKFITSPFRPVWGKFEEPGHRNHGPYTVFQHHQGDIPNQVAAIRKKIQDKDPTYFTLYANIYKMAVSGQTANCVGETNPKTACPNAITAKCAAFVYIIGLEYADTDPTIGISLGDNVFTITNIDTRKAFATKAMDVVYYAYSPGLDDGLDDVVKIPLPSLNRLDFWLNTINGLTFKSLYYRDRELMNLLQAFDMVRWGHVADGQLPDETNSTRTNTTAKKLIDHYVVPMYRIAVAVAFPFNHNNHAIMTAAALGMASVVFHDYGGYALSFDQWPNRWANASNYAIHKVMWQEGFLSQLVSNASGSLSKGGDQYGFSEGTHYVKATFQLLLPYMLTQYNYQQGDHTRTYRNYPILGLNVIYPKIPSGLIPNPFGLRMRTMYRDPDYDNLLTWYRNLVLPNGQALPVDENWPDQRFSGALAIKNKTEDGQYLCNVSSTDEAVLGLNQKVYLAPDYLAAQPTIVPYQYTSIQMADGTNIMKALAKTDGKEGFHCLLSSAERGVAKNSYWHQQNVPGHITLVADTNFLLIDPAKTNEDNEDDYWEIMRFKNHNIVYHGWELEEDVYHQQRNVEGNYTVEVTNFEPTTLSHTITTKTYNKDFLFTKKLAAEDKRTIKRYASPAYYYYVVDDLCKLHHTDDTYNQVRFNGNSETYYTLSGSKAKWDYSCRKAETMGKWGLIVETGSTGNVTYATEVSLHGAFEDDATLERMGVSEGTYWGTHATFTATSEDDEVRFVSEIRPYRCGSDQVMTTVINHDDYTMLTLKIPFEGDTIRNIHVGLDPSNSSLTNIGLLMVQGSTAFLSRADNPLFKSNGCLTYTPFRKAEIDQGEELTYDDTTYLFSFSPVTAYYELTRKFKYEGYVRSANGQNVTIFMPDLERYYPMVARNAKTLELIPSEHSDTSATEYGYITVTFPAGVTEFILELENPCMLSCFFPPTAATIDSVFDFNTGNTEPLGHKLDIVKDSGELRITNGSKMSICPDYYLYNRDSIVMSSDGANASTSASFPLYAPEEDLPGGGSGIADTNYLKRFGSDRSMIIVNNKAALILDSGSYTHVGSGSTILIRKGGTLLVKKFATLEIGSNNLNNYGEVIVEAGAYVCIEDSSDLHFFVTEQDTNDRNVFFIPVDKGVNEGVNQNAIQGDFLAGSGRRFDEGYSCLPLCSLWYYMEDYGVNNPDFGLNSVGKPEAMFTLPDDTICSFPSDTIYINAKRSRNEAKYRIYATRTGLDDSLYFRQQATDYQRLTHREMIDLSSLGTSPGTINIMVVVENTCGDTDALTQSIYIPPAPMASFTLSADSICAGTGTLTANGSASSNGLDSIYHIWSVLMIDTNQYVDGDTNRLNYGGEWVYTTTAVSNNFNFPNFNWLGGFSYVISLRVKGACSLDSLFTDTVHVPSGAWIAGDTLKIYPNIPGYTSTVLNGFASNYSSFSWSPTTGLTNSNTLNPTASPTVTTKYTLTATKGTCTVKDSVVVKVIDCAIAGYDKTICKGDTTFIGYVPMGCEPNATCYNEVYYCMPQMIWKADSTLANVNALGTSAWPSVTTTYTIYALMEQFGGGDEPPPTPIYDTVEFDQITVYVDTLPGTLFGVTHQADSTVYFSNYTQTINGATYLWIFGDGDSSTAINPIHTFPAFDSSYRVCLQATNACGMRQHCDTVWVDSLHIGLYAFGKRGNTNEPPVWVDETTPTNKPQQLLNKNVLGNNKPNPFNHTTQIDYELKPDYQTASIIITNTLGQQVQNIPLHAIKSSIVLDATTLQKGMYYYSLVVDGKQVAVKRMVVQ